MVEQSVWREGLAAPEYERTVHQVFNVIVHHTAGSNTDTLYTETVRSIYIYHTEIRGWSDIGYNYLIAPDGVIYKGRDPVIFEQDNVMGAHFCNANNGTMGISLLGTFTTILPTQAALNSLIQLINWKLGKEHLNPNGDHFHVLNSELPSIAGHRDGCSTECPGTMLYDKLDSLRTEVMAVFENCGFIISDIHTVGEPKPGVQLFEHQLKIADETSLPTTLILFDPMGRKVYSQQLSPINSYSIINLPKTLKGRYLLQLINPVNTAVYKLYLQ